MIPVRIQRKRTRGWKMPPNTIYVGRSPHGRGKWGNPYVAGMTDPNIRGINRVMVGNDELVRAFRAYAMRCIECDPCAFEPLRGKNLACWCALDQPCHADVLLELANAPQTGGGEP